MRAGAPAVSKVGVAGPLSYYPSSTEREKTVLQDLLDRLAKGGLEVTIIDMRDLEAVLGKDSPAMRASKLTDWFIRNEEVVKRINGLLESRGQSEKAKRLTTWWDELCQPMHDLGKQIPADHDGMSTEEDKAMVQRIIDVGEPIVECGRAVLKGIIDRQIEAMAQMDFDDLIS